MRMPSRSPAESSAAGTRDADSLFRTKKVAEIRAVEAATKKEIEDKKEELRQLVGKSYRDLIDSADTIVLMKSSCESISTNLDQIDGAIRSLSLSVDPETPKLTPNPARVSVYGIASRVKYLVDTPENIWGCLDESMLLEASGRYLRAKEVHGLITSSEADRDALFKFPLLRHQWQIVESFKGQISQRSRERLMDQGLTIGAYADALAAVATIDDLDPKQALGLFLDSRRSWISQKLGSFASIASVDPDSVSSVFCDLVRIIRASLGQVGELFLQVLNDLPFFYKTVLGSPPGTQLFGGIPNPEEEVRLWKLHREKLESVMVILEPEYVAQSSSSWLEGCCNVIFGKMSNGRCLIDMIGSGEELGSAEKLVRETLDGRDGLEGSLEEWLRSVFGSEIESPWNQIRGLILKDRKDILENMLEEALVRRMKEIVHSGFEDLNSYVNVRESVWAIVADPGEGNDFQSYLKKPSMGGAMWFSEPNHRKTGFGYGFKPTVDENDFGNCLNSYFGPEVSRIRDAVDSRCGVILDDLICFVESYDSAVRLKDLAPYLQEKCYKTISIILKELEDELGRLSASLGCRKEEKDSPVPFVIVKRSLFIGRLLFAFRNHSSHIPLLLGSPRQWVKETNSSAFDSLQSSLSRHSRVAFDSPSPHSPRKKTLGSPRSPRRQIIDNSRRQTISSAAALFPVDDTVKPKLDELGKILRDLCIKAHSLWISWVSDELSIILSKDLEEDDALSATASLRGWEVTMIKQESNEESLEMKIALPSMPSLYITSFLFQACQEIHKVGGHVLDKSILQKFAWKLSEKVVSIYENFLSTMEVRVPQISEKGVLQILLDLRFAADVLSGGKDSTSHSSGLNMREDSSKAMMLKPPYRRKQTQFQPDSAVTERVMGFIGILSQRLDPIDWATYEPYLWENEKQSYKRYAVLFGFLVQLNRMYTDTVQKLPTKSNTESNILRCSTVPRFKYLPISAPALSSRGAHKSSLPTSSDSASPRSPWKTYSNGEQSPKTEFDDNLSFGVATPLFKSFMTQVGSKFGESTSRLGSMLTDAQVGRFKDRSAAAMSTFGDMLPAPAAGLLSSLTAGAARSEL